MHYLHIQAVCKTLPRSIFLLYNCGGIAILFVFAPLPPLELPWGFILPRTRRTPLWLLWWISDSELDSGGLVKEAECKHWSRTGFTWLPPVGSSCSSSGLVELVLVINSGCRHPPTIAIQVPHYQSIIIALRKKNFLGGEKSFKIPVLLWWKMPLKKSITDILYMCFTDCLLQIEKSS